MSFSKIFAPLLLLLSLSTAIFSQRPVEVNFHRDAKGTAIFTAQNNTFSPYVVKVVLSKLENGNADRETPYEGVVRPGQNVLFKLIPTGGKDEMDFKYTVSFRKGTINAPVNLDYSYLLPLSTGKETQAYITDTHSGDVQTLYAVRLRMRPGDTIFTARRGIVTAVDAENGIEVFQRTAVLLSTGSFARIRSL